MKDSNKAWQVSAILCLACALIVPFNLLELYVRFKLGIELYAYIIADTVATRKKLSHRPLSIGKLLISAADDTGQTSETTNAGRKR